MPGIIPARAGFTSRRLRSGGSRADHPRSRGVYCWRMSAMICAWGSSPLARGLLPHQAAVDRHVGIIPARAGFTSRRAGHRGGPADHPRSRGVYDVGAPHRRERIGSSPLARGLHCVCCLLGDDAGIIPARAGFTRPRNRGRSSSADHPRSRGVYMLISVSSRLGWGSSPLARGLPIDTLATRALSGIIPARAGFTT